MRIALEESKRETTARAETILDRAKSEKRDLTPTEEREWEQHMADLRSVDSRLKAIDRDEDVAARAEIALRGISDQISEHRSLSSIARDVDEQFRHAIINRSNAPIDVRLNTGELRSGYRPGLEQRLATTSGSGLVRTTFHDQLVRHMVASSAILAAGATVIQTDSGEPMRVPKSTAQSVAGIVAEGAQIPVSDPTLGTTPLGAYKYAFLIEVTRELAEDANFDLLGYLAEQSGIALGNGFGVHAITGTGTAQPTGVLTAATLGNTGPTGTATSFGTHTTAGQGGDLLQDLLASVADPYARSNASAWLMRSQTLAVIRKLRDADGRYVFSSDVIPGSGSAGTLMGRPVYCDPNMPAIGANARSVLFGDFSKYYVRMVNGIRFERSDEFKFDRDTVTFRATARMDGNLVDTTGAIKYFQHSAT